MISLRMARIEGLSGLLCVLYSARTGVQINFLRSSIEARSPMDSQGKQAEGSNQIAVEQIAAILESVNYPVVVLSPDCKIQYINQSGENLVGRERQSIVGGKAKLSLPEFFG